jgi:hypothetical protein
MSNFKGRRYRRVVAGRCDLCEGSANGRISTAQLTKAERLSISCCRRVGRPNQLGVSLGRQRSSVRTARPGNPTPARTRLTAKRTLKRTRGWTTAFKIGISNISTPAGGRSRRAEAADKSDARLQDAARQKRDNASCSNRERRGKCAL